LIEGINTHEILYLSYLDFAQNFQTRTDRVEQINTWKRFNDNSGDVLFALRQQWDVMSPYKDIIEHSARIVNKPIFKLSAEDLQTNDNNIRNRAFESIQTTRNALDATINQEHLKRDSVAQSFVDSILKKTKTLPSNIQESEFYSMFQKTVFGNSKILSDLSQIFFEYYKNIDRNERKERKGKAYLNQEDFIKKFGQKPWDLIRNIFTGFGLHFDINDPLQEDIDPIDGSFQIEFKNLDRSSKSINFEDLSSGEQILITLINAIYTAGSREGLPKLILLDEVDSPLNPSIIEKFISYISENFVTNGIMVIIATHSPSTVAFAPEYSVYLVNTKDTEPLAQTNNNDAINKLSEGFITLSEVMNFEKIPQSKIIISEGKNYKYILRAKEVFANQDNDLTVLGLNIGGTGQLRTLFEFMRNFNTSKVFIFAFDCDYKYKEIRDDNGAFVKDESGIQQYENRNLESIKTSANLNNKFFIFPENSDSPSSRGIENLFNTESSNSYSGEFDQKTPKNKKSFEKYILDRNNGNDFANFQSLFNFINENNITNI
jgi:ABC-type Mn2+/Zn2+ transport system ATPase subunit